MFRDEAKHRFVRRHFLGLVVAMFASAITSLGLASAASATNENYNCSTHGGSTCTSAYGNTNYVTNDYAIDYTHDGVCALTFSTTYGEWAKACSTSYQVTVCDGGEYELYGYGATEEYNRSLSLDNLAGNQNNFKYCEG